MFISSFDKTKIWYKNWTSWKKEIQFFNKHNISTITLDLRGHGKSDKPNELTSNTLDCFAKDIHEILIKENITDFIIVGHSMGGMIALK
jgi:pimeloyl-ACP methyl ester carboxylesterase